MTAWEILSDADYDTSWDGFDARWNFRAGVDPADWPGMREPADSVTYSIGHVYGADGRYDDLTLDLCRKLVRAFRWCGSETDAALVLDWQHDCYRFWPHRDFRFESEGDWPIPVLPNGDYYIFVSESFEFGVFGHPWEQTICVFGRPLVDAFERERPRLFDRIVRIGGKPVAVGPTKF